MAAAAGTQSPFVRERRMHLSDYCCFPSSSLLLLLSLCFFEFTAKLSSLISSYFLEMKGEGIVSVLETFPGLRCRGSGARHGQGCVYCLGNK